MPPATVKAFGRQLRRFCAFLQHDDARKVSKQDVDRWKGEMLREAAAARARAARSASAFPLSLIVRAGHPLFAGENVEGRFPILRSSWAGLPLSAEIQDHIYGSPNVVEDYGALVATAAATDAIWFTSTYAVAEEMKQGILVELPDQHPQHVKVVMYTLARRSLSPLCQAMKKVLRHHIRLMEGKG